MENNRNEYIDTRKMKVFEMHIGKFVTMGRFIKSKPAVYQEENRRSELHFLKHPKNPFRKISVICHDIDDYIDLPIKDDDSVIGTLRIYPYDEKGNRITNLFSWKQNVDIKRLIEENARLKAIISATREENLQASQSKDKQVTKVLDDFQKIKKIAYFPKSDGDGGDNK